MVVHYSGLSIVTTTQFLTHKLHGHPARLRGSDASSQDSESYVGVSMRKGHTPEVGYDLLSGDEGSLGNPMRSISQ